MKNVDRVGPAAEYVGISEWKLRDMAKKGQIPYFRAGKILLFRKNSIDEWITKQEASLVSGGDDNYNSAS